MSDLRNGDDDAFGRGTHQADVSAQIEAGLIRFKMRKDHQTLAVRADGCSLVGFPWKNDGAPRLSIGVSPLVQAGAQTPSHRLPGRGGDGNHHALPGSRVWSAQLTFTDLN
jgi:hypothetical protein